MSNTPINRFVKIQKAEKWTPEERLKLWNMHKANPELSYLELGRSAKVAFPKRTEAAITGMMYILKHELRFKLDEEDRKNSTYKERSLIKEKNLSDSDVRTIVLEWYTNGMFPDMLQDDEGRDLEEILNAIPKTPVELLEKALNIISSMNELADKQTKNAIENLFQDCIDVNIL